MLLVWVIGIALGFVLYRSGICFASAFRDIFLFRDFSMARVVIIFTTVSFVGIGIMQVYAVTRGLPVTGRIYPVGFHSAVGGVLFGFGMVLAGGCASGTLQRIGEGFILFWAVVLGIVAGSVLGVYHFSWWANSFFSVDAVFIPDLIGWIPSLILTLALLGGLYMITVTVEKRKNNNKDLAAKEVDSNG
nr:YeeE/YedE thiosulfate transporter family protein [Phosphitispora fastidiosa]